MVTCIESEDPLLASASMRPHPAKGRLWIAKGGRPWARLVPGRVPAQAAALVVDRGRRDTTPAPGWCLLASASLREELPTFVKPLAS